MIEITEIESTIEKILIKNGLRKTAARVEILKLYLNNNFALSHSYIENILQNTLDRVTIYRTLSSFEEKGVIHKIVDDKGNMNYGLCHSSCETHLHQDEHVHFKCIKCEKTFCLDSHIPTISIPTNYKIENYFVFVTGTCPTCI